MKQNPDIRMRKRWKQNKSLAKVPRLGHSEVDGTSVDFDEKFLVPLILKNYYCKGSTSGIDGGGQFSGQ